MPKLSSTNTGAAGEHYVAYKLLTLGYIAALPRGGSPTVDILASNTDGSKLLSIQVKTTDYAMRTRGRGDNKVPFELQFPLGYKGATKEPSPNLIFAFVDLQSAADHKVKPDIYFIPSKFIFDYCKSWVEDVKMVRFHIEIAKMEEFKNNYSLLRERLD